MGEGSSTDRGSGRKMKKLSAEVSKNPRSKVFVTLAEEYVKAGMLAEAATVLEEGLLVYPLFVTALVALGRVYLQLDDRAKAKEVLEEAVKASPDNLMAHRMRARIYAQEHAWEVALQACEMVLFTNPKDNEMVALKAEINGQGGPDASSPPPQVVAQPGLDMSAADKETRAGRLQELLGRVQARRAS